MDLSKANSCVKVIRFCFINELANLLHCNYGNFFCYQSTFDPTIMQHADIIKIIVDTKDDPDKTNIFFQALLMELSNQSKERLSLTEW